MKKITKLEKNLLFLAQRNTEVQCNIIKGVVERNAAVERNITTATTNAIIGVAKESGIKSKKIKKILKSSKISAACEDISKDSVKKVNKTIDKIVDSISIPNEQLKDIGLSKPISKSVKRIDKKYVSKITDIDKISGKHKKSSDKDEKKKRKLEKENDEAAKETANFISKSMKGLKMDSNDVSTLPKSGGKKKKVKKSSGAKFTEDMLKGMNFAD